MQRALHIVSQAIQRFAMLCTLIMLILVVSDVASRGFLNIAIPGVDTIVASYLMVAVIFLPLAMLHILDENITVSVVYDAVPNVVKDLFDILAHILAFGYYIILAWVYYKVAVESFEIKEFITGTWDVPIWPARIFMPLGLFMGSVVSLGKLIATIQDMVAGAPAEHKTTGVPGHD